MMTRICFPHHTKGEYDSLEQALNQMKRTSYGWDKYNLQDIVQYNICYRDHLRAHGYDALVNRLLEEAPSLKAEQASLDCLAKWWQRVQPLADYDIQCYNIQDRITILGHEFNGLKEIQQRCSMIGMEILCELSYWTVDGEQEFPGIHVGGFHDSYPVFDSYDLGDDRTYQNYLFRTAPITKKEMEEVYKTPHSANSCMVHERIPAHRLPLLYYSGDGKYMLLATNKEN